MAIYVSPRSRKPCHSSSICMQIDCTIMRCLSLVIVALLSVEGCARRQLSSQWAVELQGEGAEQRAEELARRHGMLNRGQVRPAQSAAQSGASAAVRNPLAPCRWRGCGECSSWTCQPLVHRIKLS